MNNVCMKERIEKKLVKWVECNSLDELNSKWINAKKYIALRTTSIEERFELDKLIESYYAIAASTITN